MQHSRNFLIENYFILFHFVIELKGCCLSKTFVNLKVIKLLVTLNGSILNVSFIGNKIELSLVSFHNILRNKTSKNYIHRWKYKE